jgi:hypothetical protein
MTTINKLEKVLKMASRTLVKNKSISTTICIRSKNAAISPIFIHPQWIDEADKTKVYVELQKVCQEIEADEVLMVCEDCIDEHNSPFFGGIRVSLLNSTGIQTVILPFEKSKDGEILFGKEFWEPKKEKNLAGRMVGLVH